MIEIFKQTKDGLEETTSMAKHTWICLTKPDERELKRLRKIIPVQQELVDSLRDIDEIPTFSKRKGYTFVVLRVPKEYGLEEEELQFATIPIGIFFTKDYFVTISFFETDLFSKLKKLEFKMGGIEPVLMAFYALSRSYLSALKKLQKELYATEGNLERATTNEEILQLLEIEKSLVFFGTSLNANHLILGKIAQSPQVKRDQHYRELVDDTRREIKQAMNMVKIYSIINSEMVNAFSSVISNNLNKVIKTLTVVTLILMLPTLVASVYGMNITLPFQHHPYAFEITMGISALLSIVGAMVFWSSRWF